MKRRTVLATAGSLGTLSLAGCGLVASDTTISNPTVGGDEDRRHLTFESDGEDLAELGVSVKNRDAVPIRLLASVWHREGTELENLKFGFDMPPEGDGLPTRVAIESPMAGDSDPKPSVSLYEPRDGEKVVEVTDLGELSDETVNLAFLVEPRAESARTLLIDATIGLEGDGVRGASYTLEGQLEFEFPDVAIE